MNNCQFNNFLTFRFLYNQSFSMNKKYIQIFVILAVLLFKQSSTSVSYTQSSVPTVDQSDYGSTWQCRYQNYTNNITRYFRLQANTTNATVESLQWISGGHVYYIACNKNFQQDPQFAVVNYNSVRMYYLNSDRIVTINNIFELWGIFFIFGQGDYSYIGQFRFYVDYIHLLNNTANYSIIRNVSFPDPQDYLGIDDLDVYLATVIRLNNTDNILQKMEVRIYNQNLSQILYSYIFAAANTNFITIKYNYTRNFVILSFLKKVQIRNMSANGSLVRNFSFQYQQVKSALICSAYLIIFTNNNCLVYNATTWQSLLLINTTGEFNLKRVKCFAEEGKVAYKYQINNTYYIKYITFNQIVPETSQGQVNKQSQESKLLKTTKQATEIIKSEQVINGLAIASQMAGMSSVTTLLQSTFRPFLAFIQQFWLYGFHSQIYPEFVETLTTEMDLLNQLRIKPEFMNFEIDIQQLTQENLLLNKTRIIHERSPSSKFMLQSIKDIYTVNLALVIVNFLLYKLLFLIADFLKDKHPLLNKMRKLFRQMSLWWTLLVGFFESNIPNIVFYAGIQLNMFFYFNSLSKLNLVFTVSILFATFVYCFTFYPLLYRYGKQSSWRKICEFSLHNRMSFLLQMILRSLRIFFQSFIHGVFINRHSFQLGGLILFDIIVVILLISLRHKFDSKINFFFISLFYVLFLTFDIGLLVYTIDVNLNEFDELRALVYNFTFILIVLGLFLVTLLRMLISLIIVIKKSIKKIRIGDKIADQKKKNPKIKVIFHNKNSKCEKKTKQCNSKKNTEKEITISKQQMIQIKNILNHHEQRAKKIKCKCDKEKYKENKTIKYNKSVDGHDKRLDCVKSSKRVKFN